MAVATNSLATTTFASGPVEQADSLLTLTSTADVKPGYGLFVERELMVVDRLGPLTGQVVVRRGCGGSAATAHATNAAIYIGRMDQFYQSDPVGLPPAQLPVYPYINVVNGKIWIAQGDEAASDLQGRVWAEVTTAMTTGALGIRQMVTTTPT